MALFCDTGALQRYSLGGVLKGLLGILDEVVPSDPSRNSTDNDEVSCVVDCVGMLFSMIGSSANCVFA